MAGHSKWSNIKHRKGRQDEVRSKTFQKLAKELHIAAKTGDPDPDTNPLLRLVITKAKAANMPNDKINHAINKAKNNNNDQNYVGVRYEGYGPGGVAIMLDCLTDNKNRTASQVRAAFNKYNGNLGTDGSVSYLFKRVGVLTLPLNFEEDKIIEQALTAGAIDITKTHDYYQIVTNDKDLLQVKQELEQNNIKDFKTAEITYLAINHININNEQINELISALTDIDDVNNVYHNLKTTCQT